MVQDWVHARRKAREFALQILYGVHFTDVEAQQALDIFWRNFFASKPVKDFATFLVRGTLEHLQELDELIASCSDNWSLDRMSRVDINILRLAVYELVYCDDIPPKVTINEAVDLGKTFGSENSGAFVNGILDALNIRLRKKNANQSFDRKF